LPKRIEKVSGKIIPRFWLTEHWLARIARGDRGNKGDGVIPKTTYVQALAHQQAGGSLSNHPDATEQLLGLFESKDYNML